jgi:2-polyprenyl-6-methoxyphenol hydroxylase-like FAD-dependent oxidoreductase
MADSSLLIAGGGIAGLAAALGLAKAGIDSHILERTPAFETTGAGIQLGPNAVRALQYLGAWDAVAPHCVSPEQIHIRDGKSGKILQRVVLGKKFEQRFGAPYRVAHRADLQNGLLSCVRAKSSIHLQTNAEVADISIAQTALTLRSGETRHAPAIIASDGIHSIIRKRINPASSPNNTGHTLFRALIPTASIPSIIETNVVTLWLYPGAHVVHYAVSGGPQFNIVASVETHGVSPLEAFRDACSPLIEIIKAQGNWTTWPGIDIQPNSNWSHKNTLLIGDAAHASMPYLAQGAAMALEDACVLSQLVNKDSNFSEVFQKFSALRFNRTRAIQNRSAQLGKIYHAKNPLRPLINLALRIQPSNLFLSQFSWIYDWQVKIE